MAEQNDLRDRPIGELLRELAHDTGELVRQEIALAKSELSEKLDTTRAELVETAHAARVEATQTGTVMTKELRANAKEAWRAAGLWGAAAAAGLAAVGALTAFLVLAPDGAVANWLAALIVTAVWAGVAGVLMVLGRNRLDKVVPLVSPQTIEQGKERFARLVTKRKDELQAALMPVPEQTIETLKEDVEWAKHPTRSART